MSCQGKTRSNKKCNKYLFNDNKYCDLHDYFNKFSEQELSNLVLCSGCNKWKLNDGNKTCEACRTRVKTKKEVAKCKKENCTFDAHQDNEYLYCGKHGLDYWYYKNIKEGINKPCNGYLRGCREILDYNYGFTRCEKCRAKERAGDNTRMTKRISDRREYNKDFNSKTKICTCCNKNLPKKEFEKEYSDDLHKQCRECREKNRVRDAEEKRIEQKKLYEKTEGRKEWKARWKTENKDKVRNYYLEARKKKIDELGLDKYREKCAQMMKDWRDDKDDLITNYYGQRRLKPNEKFNYYRRTADRKSLCFCLEYSDCNKLFESPCYYCGMAKTDKLNIGIDRLDSFEGYTLDNSVPCCEDCNLVKNTIPYDVFIDKVHHILSYNKLIDEGEYYFNFDRPCTMSTTTYSYNYYIKTSKARKIEFNLTEEEYYNLKKQKCYICGVKPDDILYKNGIDRIDSKIGYIIDNCKACCKECNIMKRRYTIDELYDRYLKIYNNLIKGTDRKPVSQEALNDRKNTVVCYNENKLAKETLEIIKEYDYELKKNLQIMKTTDDGLIKLRSKGKYDEADEYIKNVIMPKAVEKTQTYFKENKPDNPMLTMKDDLNKLVEFNKKIKEKKNLLYSIEEMTRYIEKYKKIPLADRTEKDKRDYEKYSKALYRHNKSNQQIEKRYEVLKQFIEDYKKIPIDKRTEEDTMKYNRYRVYLNANFKDKLEDDAEDKYKMMEEYIEEYKKIPLNKRTDEDTKKYNNYRVALNKNKKKEKLLDVSVKKTNEEPPKNITDTEDNSIDENMKDNFVKAIEKIPVDERDADEQQLYDKIVKSRGKKIIVKKKKKD